MTVEYSLAYGNRSALSTLGESFNRALFSLDEG